MQAARFACSVRVLPSGGELGTIPRAVRRFSLSILKQQVDANETDTAALVAAVERCLLELGTFLRGLVGAEGYRTLLARAIHLAANEYPALEAVRANADPPGRIVGLSQVVHRAPPSQARDLSVAILAAMVWLLTTFVGEDLTLSLLREVWPALPELQSLSGESD
jgi:hypothetical protein